MHLHHHHDKGPGFLPTQGRCFRPISDHRLKTKARRQERRKARETIRAWLAEGEPDPA